MVRVPGYLWKRRFNEETTVKKLFSEETTVKKGVELLQDLVATETFNNLRKLSNIRRASVSAFSVLFISNCCFFDFSSLAVQKFRL
jgi:hypothetical protein